MCVDSAVKRTKRPRETSLADFYQLEDRDIFAKTRAFGPYVEKTKANGHYLYRRTLVNSCENRVVVRDEETGREREMIMLASNNYLGLTNHPKVVEAGMKALEDYGIGAGSVPLLAGTLKIHRELEARLAAFKGCEDAIVFSSGYSSNVGAIAGLARAGDMVINDSLNHASIIDGCRLSGATAKAFPHMKIDSLDKLLDRSKDQYQGKLVVLDGVFSMDGDIAPLPELIEICQRHGARLMIDEAHATGVIGSNGRGTPEHHGVEGEVDIVAGTLSKALGAVGGFVASSHEVIQYIRFYARSYMFSTALPPSTSASVLAGLDVIENEPQLRQQLWDNIRFLKTALEDAGFNLGNSETAIFPLILGDDQKVKEMSRLLHEKGIYVNAVFYPAVARRLSRVRLSVMATHTREDLETAVAACIEAGEEVGAI